MKSQAMLALAFAIAICFVVASPAMAATLSGPSVDPDGVLTLCLIGVGVVTAKALREKRAEVYTSVRALADRANDEKHDWNQEDEEEWKRVNSEYDALTRQIELRERVERLESEERSSDPPSPPGRENPGSPGPDGRGGSTPGEARALALRAWFRHQAGVDLTDDEIEACRSVGMNPSRRELRLDLNPTQRLRAVQERFRRSHPSQVDVRAGLNVGTDAEGGYTVPEGFVNNLEANMLYFGPMMQVADIIRTDSGNDLPWPTADDTSNTGAQLDEATTIGTSVDPSFAVITWKAFKFSSKLVKVSAELLEDSAFDLAMTVSEMLGQRLGRILNTKFTTGAGGGTTPGGIVTDASAGVTAAGTTAITTDEIINLEHSVDIAYRRNAAYMMHDNVMLYIRKLKDSENRYLFQSNLREGAPDQINGRPVYINNDMASSITASAKTVLFGQLDKYKVRQVREIRLRRLVERYADTDEEGFVAFLRADGHLLDAGTAPVKYLVQAAS